MFRTVLLNTGLYREDKRSGAWNYASPRAVKSNNGLEHVWSHLQTFLTKPQEKPKDIAKFFRKLKSPPIGLRAGVIPILFAAGLKAFATAVSITRRGQYLNDILPTDIEDICRNPDDYRLTVLELHDKQEKYLRKFFKQFSSVAAYEIPHNDLIRQCFDALQAWKAQLPPAALTTRQLSAKTLKFRDSIVRINDPVRLLMRAIPDACGVEVVQYQKLMKRVDGCADELAAVATAYGEKAGDCIRNCIGLGRSQSDQTISQICVRWASCFSDDFVESLSDGSQKAFVTRLNHDYGSDNALVDALGNLLVGRGLSRWDDSTIHAFQREFQNRVRSVEDASLTATAGADSEGVTELIYGRIQELYDRLEERIGRDASQAILDSVVIGQDRESLWHRSAK
jgi:hypothetical protein